MTIKPLRERPAVKLALLGLIGSLVAVGAGSRPSASAAADDRAGPKPTVVLVHGAWADASSWNGVVERLEDRGYTVIAPPNPLRNLQNDAAYLSSILATISGPIVLVGHSYGGMVMTDAATGLLCDVPTSTAAVMAATQRPIDAAVLAEPSGPPAWRTIPSWYLVASDDHAIPPATERFMARRAGATTVEIPASHVAMVSHPDAVVELIERAAAAVLATT